MKNEQQIEYAFLRVCVTKQKRVMECFDITCANGGECHEGTCNCSHPFSGSRCEIELSSSTADSTLVFGLVIAFCACAFLLVLISHRIMYYIGHAKPDSEYERVRYTIDRDHNGN